jgi:hypothetical protein
MSNGPLRAMAAMDSIKERKPSAPMLNSEIVPRLPEDIYDPH